MKVKLFFIILVFIGFSSMYATTYYSKSIGNLNLVGTWGTSTNGSGTAPANFTTAGNTFIIVNNAAATIAAAWTVSGAGSVIQVGDGTQTINFAIPTGFSVTGTINVTNNSTVTINNATNPTLGTLASGSTVAYSDAAAQTVLNATYYNLTLGGSGKKTLANTASSTVTNSLTINTGIAFQLNTSTTYTLALNGTLSGSGTITGGNRSNLSIGGSGIFGTLIPTTATLTLNNFIINRGGLGTVTLGGNVTARTSCNFSNGVLVLNGKTLTLGGTLTFPAASTNGTITGSATSNISITASTITNNLYMTIGAQTLNNLTLNATAGKILTLGTDLTVSGAYLQTRGIVNLNGHTLTLNGTSATFASSTANGTTTGSATSNLIISATTIGANNLFMTVGSQTLNNLTLSSPAAQSLILGTALTVSGAFTQTSGILNLNSQILTLNGTVTFPAASTNGTISGTTTSDLIINATSITNDLYMTAAAVTLRNLTLNSPGKTLTLGSALTVSGAYTQTNGIVNLNGQALTLSGTIVFPAALTNGTISGTTASTLSITATSITNDLYMTTGAQTLGTLVLNATAGQTLTLGTDLSVSGTYTQTKGIININGHTLTLGGAVTFASSVANGTTTGSATSNLIINATTIAANSLFMTTGAETLNNFTLNSAAAQALTLGTALTVSGAYTQTSGILKLNSQILALNGTVTFPAASTNGTITGTTTSDLIINATSITNDLYMTAAAGLLRNLTLNSAGQTLTLGSALTVSGAYTQTNGIVNLNGQALTLSGTIVFPVASTNGTISGTAASTLSITATSITNDLYMTTGSQTLGTLILNATAGQTLTLGTDLSVSGTYTQTKGIVNINGHTLTLGGAVTFASTVANGTTTGSATSNLIINATTIAANSLFMTVGSQTLNNLTLNSAAAQTLVLGTALTVSGAYTQTSGILKLNGQTLTLTGTVTFPVASTNGTITGSTTSNLLVSGTSITNTLFFTTGALALNNFTVNSAGQTLKLGTALTLTGTFTHTKGIIDLNGQTLTCNGPVVFPTSVANGSFTGSSLSSLSIATPAGGAVTNSMFMTQTNSTTNSLLNVTLNRTGSTLTLGNQLNLIGELLPTLGTFASTGNLTLVASSATVTAYIGPIGGSVTGNVTAQAYEAGNLTGWTLMGSPGITGRTMADWNNSFYITCPSCPDGDGTAQNGSAFTSVDSYSETVGGLMSDAPRYIGITSITNAINIGQGYWVYLGNGTTTTGDIIVNMTGPVKQGNVAMPLTITNIGAGTPATDHGYNLLANPYPAPISWTSLRAANANVSATMYVYNPDLNGYATYISTSNISSPAVGSGGIGDKIPAGQGFYVKATAAATLTAKETFKAASNQQLLRTANHQQVQQTASTSQPELFRLQASGNSMNNETVIYFDPNATPYYNANYDAISLGVDPGFLGIVSELNDTSYAIKGLPPLMQNVSMPIKTITSITGSYQITALDLQNLPEGACIRLHDKYMNTDWDLRTGPYNCTLNDTETVARFVLNIVIDPTLSVSGSSLNPTCAKSANGYMIASASGSTPWNYYWKDANSNIIKTSLNKTTTDTLRNANGGKYSVDINTGGSCNNGTVTYTLQGSMSANALFTPSTTFDSLVNNASDIHFTNGSTNASTYLWNFGDGTQAASTDASHTYTSAGTYTVALSAYDQTCGDTSIYYQTIIIDTTSGSTATTGVKSITTTVQKNGMEINRDATGYYVQFNYQTKTSAVISVQNLLGEKVVADIKQENIANNKTYISLGNTSNNVLIISVNTSSGEKTFRKVINY